jgi:hypothetical protein
MRTDAMQTYSAARDADELAPPVVLTDALMCELMETLDELGIKPLGDDNAYRLESEIYRYIMVSRAVMDSQKSKPA